MADIYERIQNLPNLQYAISKGESDAIQELKDLYQLALGRTMKRECYSCRIRAYTELVNLTPTNIEIMSKAKKYTLKDKDGLIEFDQSHYVASTLTDEVAEALIKSNPANKDLFDIAEDEAKPSKTK